MTKFLNQRTIFSLSSAGAFPLLFVSSVAISTDNVYSATKLYPKHKSIFFAINVMAITKHVALKTVAQNISLPFALLFLTKSA